MKSLHAATTDTGGGGLCSTSGRRAFNHDPYHRHHRIYFFFSFFIMCGRQFLFCAAAEVSFWKISFEISLTDLFDDVNELKRNFFRNCTVTNKVMSHFLDETLMDAMRGREQKAPVVSVEMSAVGVVVCYAIEPSHPSQFKSFPLLFLPFPIWYPQPCARLIFILIRLSCWMNI